MVRVVLVFNTSAGDRFVLWQEDMGMSLEVFQQGLEEMWGMSPVRVIEELTLIDL